MLKIFETLNYIFLQKTVAPRQDSLVVHVSTSHAVGREFVSQPGHTKDHDRNSTNCLEVPAWHAGIRVAVWQCNPTV